MWKQHCRFAKNKVWIRTKWNVWDSEITCELLGSHWAQWCKQKKTLLQVVPVLAKKVKQTLKNKQSLLRSSRWKLMTQCDKSSQWVSLCWHLEVERREWPQVYFFNTPNLNKHSRHCAQQSNQCAQKENEASINVQLNFTLPCLLTFGKRVRSFIENATVEPIWLSCRQKSR